METMWRWFFRFVVGVGALFAVVSVLFVIGMNRAHVTESNGFTNVTPEAENTTLSQTLPKTASGIHVLAITSPETNCPPRVPQDAVGRRNARMLVPLHQGGANVGVVDS